MARVRACHVVVRADVLGRARGSKFCVRQVRMKVSGLEPLVLNLFFKPSISREQRRKINSRSDSARLVMLGEAFSPFPKVS